MVRVPTEFLPLCPCQVMRLLEKLSFSLNLLLHLENENVELSSYWSSLQLRDNGEQMLWKFVTELGS